MVRVQGLEAPIISQVWDLLEASDDQSARLQRSWSHPSDDGVTSAGDAGGGGGGSRRLSIKKFFKNRTLRNLRRPSGEQQQTAWSDAGGSDGSGLLSDRVIAGIPSSDIDLANYIIAHGILSKELRSDFFPRFFRVYEMSVGQERI